MIPPKKNIFSRMDEWLRINHPLVWRTRLHHFIVFSFFITNFLLWCIIPNLLVRGTNSFPTPDTLLMWSFLIFLIESSFILYWGYQQTKTPLGEPNFKGYFYTWIFYIICISCIILNSTIFIHPTVLKIINLESIESLEATYQFHEENDFWMDSPSLNEDKLARHKERIKSDLEKYATWEFQSDFYIEESLSNYDDTVRYSLNTPYGKIYDSDLITKIEYLKIAHGYKNDIENDYAFTYTIFTILFFLSPVLAGLLVILSLPKHVFTRNFQFNIPNIINYKSDDKTRNISGLLDSYLLNNFPTIWSTNIHNYLIHVFILFVGMGLFMWIMPFDITIFKRFIHESTNSFNANILILFILFSISFPFWGYNQVTTKNPPSEVYKNVSLLGTHFFIISLVPLLITIIFNIFHSTNLFVEINMIPTIIFVSFCLAIWAYSAKFMSTRKSLYLGIPFIFSSLIINGAIFSTFIIVSTFNSNDDIEYNYIFISIFYIISLFILSRLISKSKNIKILFGFSLYYLSSILIIIGIPSILFSMADDAYTSDKSTFILTILLYFIYLVLLPILSIPAIALLVKAKSLPRE